MPVEHFGVKMLNLREAATLIGVSYATIKNYHNQGRIRGNRVGRNILVPEEDLKRLVLGDEPAPGTAPAGVAQ